MAGDDLTIGDLERETGLSRRTIRWYISEGLVGRPDTRGRGARYTRAHLDRLRAIQRLRDGEGLTISGIRRRLQRTGADELRRLGGPSASPELEAGRLLNSDSPAEPLRRSSDEMELDPYRHEWPRTGDSMDRPGDMLERRAISSGALAGPAGAPPPTAPIDRLAYELQQVLGNRRVPRQVRSEPWHQLQVTPDIVLSVRGERDAEHISRLERVADYLREILVGGVEPRRPEAPTPRADPGPRLRSSDDPSTHSFRLVDGHPVVTIEGKRLLLDTGSPTSVGSAYTWAGRPVAARPSFLGFDLAAVNALLVEPVDALVGADAIAGVWLSLSADRGTARISRTPFAMPGLEVELSSVGGVPSTRVRVRGEAVTALIDTAARLSYVDARLVDGLTSEAEQVEDFFPGLGTYWTPVFSIAVEIGGEKIPVPVGLMPSALREAFSLTGAEMVLGLGPVLARYDVGIAMPDGRMVLQAAPATGFSRSAGSAFPRR